MEQKKIESLSGKWIYSEDYGYGNAKGELFLEQKGRKLSGKIIFLENVSDGESFMIQEKLEGKIVLNRIYLKAIEYDIIHSDHEIGYELDSWSGMLINETSIEGDSIDDQGVMGSFKFEKVVEVY